jgi:DNA-binding NtrC family response regulator
MLVVDEDREVLEALGADLGRRFGVDFQILVEGSPTRALAVLRDLAAESRQVALVFAGRRMNGSDGVRFLMAAHALHPAAKRILRLDRGDYSSANPAVRAMTLGQIDYHLFTPWQPSSRPACPACSPPATSATDP